ALEIHRRFERAADAGDHDLVELVRFLVRSLRDNGCQDRGPEYQGNRPCDGRACERAIGFHVPPLIYVSAYCKRLQFDANMCSALPASQVVMTKNMSRLSPMLSRATRA